MTKHTGINTKILEWAVNYSNQGAALSVRFPKLKHWISKDDIPTVRQLEKFSKATNVPFGYFFLEKPPVVTLSIPFFRTIKDEHGETLSSELIDTVRIIEQRRDWLSDYLKKKGADELTFVGRYKKNQEIKIIAESIRAVLQLSENWAEKQPNWNEALNFLMLKTEDAGINVVRNGVVGNNTHRKLNYKEFRGFVLVDKYAPFVFINGTDFKSAQMFTLAHELAHIWIGNSAVFDLRQMLPAEDEAEILCDKVAAELLVPENFLNENWNRFKLTDDPYQAIATTFKVSKIVAARRVLDLNLISKDEFFNFYNEYTSKQYKDEKKEGGNFYNTQPYRIGKRFGNAVITAAKEGSLLYRDAYRLTGLNANSFSVFEEGMK